MDKPERSESAARLLDGTSWREFCRALEQAGQVVLDPRAPADPLDRAEGFRYLSRLLRAGLETFVEDADADAPELLRTCHTTIKMGADNPDNLYQNAPLHPRNQYRLSGTRGTVHYLGFGTQEGNYGATGGLATVGYLDDSRLEIEPDGRFTVHISATPQPGNWLPMSDKTRTLVVRQTFLDRKNERPAELHIERVGGRHAPRPVSPESLDRSFAAAARFVSGCAGLFARWADDLAARPNQLPRFDEKLSTAAGGVPHIAYYHGYWQLQPGEALVIEATPPECDYWNFQLNNHWMESLDYRYFPISINKHSAVTRDGRVRVVVAGENPANLPNWLDTCGHTRGTMCWRWVRASDHPTPATRVVPLAEVRA